MIAYLELVKREQDRKTTNGFLSTSGEAWGFLVAKEELKQPRDELAL